MQYRMLDKNWQLCTTGMIVSLVDVNNIIVGMLSEFSASGDIYGATFFENIIVDREKHCVCMYIHFVI